MNEQHYLDEGELTVEIGAAISVTLTWEGGEPSRIELPRPSSGYGGHELVVSKNERYAVLWLHSGQSEVGYEVFELSAQLRHIYSLPYQLGTSDPAKFSADGRWLVMVVREHGSYYWYDEHGNAREADEGEVDDVKRSMPWAKVFALRLPRAELTTAMITLETVDPVPRDELEVYDRLGRVDEDDFTFRLPGDDAQRIDLPPSDETFEVSRTR